MKLIKLKCDGCGALLKVNENLKNVQCNYCGAKFLVDDGNTTHTYRKIDEAKIKEIEYKDLKDKRDNKFFFICMGMLLGIAMLCLGISFLIEKQSEPNKNEIKVPMSSKYYEGENYKEIKKELKTMGFKNIELVAKKDLVTGWITKDGEIEKISIDGDSKFEEGTIFSKDAEIIITYHTFK